MISENRATEMQKSLKMKLLRGTLAVSVILISSAAYAQSVPDTSAIAAQIPNTPHPVSKIDINDETLKGIIGGTLKTIDVPDNAKITGINIYHSDDRVFGFNFKYLDEYGDSQTTDLIGGNAGSNSSRVTLSQDAPLKAIRFHYSADPAKHYLSPVLTGIEFDVFNRDPASDEHKTQSFGNVSARSKADVTEMSFPRSHGLDSLSACISPQDRNGRLFSLSANIKMPDGSAGKLGTFSCGTINPEWANQPLGPKRIEDDFQETPPDPYEIASGTYVPKMDVGYKINGGILNPDQRFAVSSPVHANVEFGDTAIIQFEKKLSSGRLYDTNNPNQRQVKQFYVDRELFLIDDPKSRGDYTFVYESVIERQYAGIPYTETVTLGVTINKVTSRQGEGEARDYSTRFVLTRQEKFPGTPPKTLSDEYIAAPLQGPGEFSASQNWRRPNVVESEQSQKGLFEISNVIPNFGHMYAGYDTLEMSLDSYLDGVKKPIFDISGPYQYYLPTTGAKAVPDGIYYIEFTTKTGQSKTFTMSTQKSIENSTSLSLGGSVPIKGIPVGVNYSRSESKKISRNKSATRSFSSARGISQIFVNDLPNVFLTQGFSREILCLYKAVENRKSDFDRNGKACNSTEREIADDIVQSYGTSYAHAIAYGGRAIDTKFSNAKSKAEEHAKSQSIGLVLGSDEKNSTNSDGEKDGTEKASKGNVGLTQTERDTNTASDSLSKSGFKATGGSGANMLNWDVTSETSVPILYDLKPLSDLMNVIIFNKARAKYAESGQFGSDIDDVEYDAETMTVVRNKLSDRIKKFAKDNQGEPTEIPEAYLYELSFFNLKCNAPGDDGDNVLEIETRTENAEEGGLMLNYTDSSGEQALQIYGPKTDNVKCVSTENGSENASNSRQNFDKKTLVFFDPGEFPKNESFATVSVKGLFENDPSAFDADEEFTRAIFLGDSATKKTTYSLRLPPTKGYDESPIGRVFVVGDQTEDSTPTITFDYTWKRIRMD